MTQDEFQKVMQIVQNLDNYASASDVLNTHRVWHVRWERLYDAVKQELCQLVEAESDTPDPPPSTPCPEPGEEETKP